MPDVVGKIALSVAAAVAVVLTVRRLPDLWHRPRPSDAISRWFSGDQLARAWPVVAVLGSFAAVVVSVAVWSSDGNGAADWMGTTVTVVVIGFMAVSLAVGWAGFPRFLVPPSLRAREGRDAHHEVVVNDVRPGPGRDERAYFVAMCTGCDWIGGDRATEDEARRDAERHSGNVRAELARPVA